MKEEIYLHTRTSTVKSVSLESVTRNNYSSKKTREKKKGNKKERIVETIRYAT